VVLLAFPFLFSVNTYFPGNQVKRSGLRRGFRRVLSGQNQTIWISGTKCTAENTAHTPEYDRARLWSDHWLDRHEGMPVMGCYVVGIRIVFSSHPKKPCKTKYAIRLVGILPLA